MSIVNQPVITNDREAAKKVFELILQIQDVQLAEQLTAVATDALIAKYKKGIDDGFKIGKK